MRKVTYECEGVAQGVDAYNLISIPRIRVSFYRWLD
jgi:hypothetical protein